MARSAASSSRGSSVALNLAGVVSLALFGAACGGGGDDGVTAVDAAVDGTTIDASTCAGMICGGECFDTFLDEDHCGSCTTVCDPGQACQASDGRGEPGCAAMPNPPSRCTSSMTSSGVPASGYGAAGKPRAA